MSLIKNSLFLAFALCLVLVGHHAWAQISSSIDDPPDNSSSQYTSVGGTAFQEAFNSGASYARVRGSGQNRHADISIVDGIMTDCGVVKDGVGAQVKFATPANAGTYNNTYALYYELGTPGRAFSSAQVTVSSVSDTMVYGSVHLVSVNGVLDGPFAAQICQ